MGNIKAEDLHMDVLDAYAKRITKSQAERLYESKVGKKYIKKLNENVSFTNPSDYQLYLNAYTIALELDTNKTNMLMELNNKHSKLMESLSYRVDSDAVLFSTPNKEIYESLLSTMVSIGFSEDTINEIRDEKL